MGRDWSSAVRRCAAAAAVVLVVVVLPAARSVAAALAVTSALAWAPCGGRLQCATVTVPLDYGQPTGATISIALARFPASDPAHRIGSLFVNPGGPGGSGIAWVQDAGAALDRLVGGRFDIVGFDPRGVGASTSVRCFTGAREQALFYANESIFPDGPAAEQRYVVKTGVWTGLCGTRNRVLLAHLSTADTARDLDRLRAAVGDPTLTYFGISYGTLLGATYANLFPTRVRALALDGVSDPDAYTHSLFDWTAGSLRDTEAVRAGFAGSCAQAGPSRCALAGHGDVDHRIRALLARLHQAPIPAPTAPVPGVLDYPTAVAGIFIGLYDTGRWPALAQALAAADAGDGSPFLRLLYGDAQPPAARAQPSDYDNAGDALAAILCTDSPAPRDPAGWPAYVHRLARISPTGAGVVGWAVGLPCASWPARATAGYTGPWNAPTSHPVLLIGVTHDPITPLASAQKLARLMGPSAVLLTHDGYGHSSGGQPSSCTTTALSTYLVTAVPPVPGTICRAGTPPFQPAPPPYPIPHPRPPGPALPTR